MKATQTWCTLSATACAGASPRREPTSRGLTFSTTYGISTAWKAPNRWRSAGSEGSKRYVQRRHLGVHGACDFLVSGLAPGTSRDPRDPDGAEDDDES
ncbi:hypothetical protein LDL08_15050 [Nonomuraea glycinis]|uniref:Uncharacterized protein n=1 Tax=Nonomuraea glycinis TaxID=2047744 RepID=A0A918A7J4_9ACTN|nr:hypothetical protein [Nonomuraea glycinis]MCA2177505.1 hypothetical protein [Nonomuraea glycinis]GGP09438.1 hypothetical protein GCM10012278_45130 [Nonomuraea glycinis]